MSRFVFTLVVLAVATITLLPAATGAPPASKQEVTVVNTPAQAVPVAVQGTVPVAATQAGSWAVDVLGTPTFKLAADGNTVKAQQAGTWTVGIDGTPTVTIAGTPTVGISPSANTVQLAPPASPIPVASDEFAGKTPVQVFKHYEPLGFDLFTTLYTVPAGKRLVIEYVTINTDIPINSGAFAFITTQVGSTTARFYVPTSFQSLFNGGTTAIFEGQQITRLYADAGTAVGYEVHRSTGAGPAENEISFSGYLVDA